ncbi:unnamed protein product, partial [Acanthoscelides obtectus]
RGTTPHTSAFPPPSERNIHAIIRGIPATFNEQEVKEELEQKDYSPHHIIRLKRNGGIPMPLMVLILPKIDKSQQIFTEHELLGLAIRVQVQKNTRLLGSVIAARKVANEYFCKHEELLEADPCLVEIIQNGNNRCTLISIQQSKTVVQQISPSKVIVNPREPSTVHSSCPEDGLIVISQPSIIELQRCSIEVNQQKFYPSDHIKQETSFPLPTMSHEHFQSST